MQVQQPRSALMKPPISASSPPIGGTPRAHRQCSTGLTRCGWGFCAQRLMCIGLPIRRRCGLWRASARSMSAAVRDFCASHWPGLVHRFTGVDAAPENIAAASAHAAGAGLTIDYRCGDVAQLGLHRVRSGNFDGGNRTRFRQVRVPVCLGWYAGTGRTYGAFHPQSHRQSAAADGRRGRSGSAWFHAAPIIGTTS
jgi:hypothetical protein